MCHGDSSRKVAFNRLNASVSTPTLVQALTAIERGHVLTAAPLAPPPAPLTPALSAAAAAWGQVAVASGQAAYDPLKFYCKATDTKGHGERVGFKVPPEIYAQVMNLVYSRDFPDYESPPDFFRDAAVHRLAQLADKATDPGLREAIKDVVTRLAFMDFSAKVKYEVEMWEHAHEDFRETLSKLEAAGAWGQVWEYLRRASDIIDAAPEPFRSTGMDVLSEWRDRVPQEWRA
jgi:hypothetical protein